MKIPRGFKSGFWKQQKSTDKERKKALHTILPWWIKCTDIPHSSPEKTGLQIHGLCHSRMYQGGKWKPGGARQREEMAVLSFCYFSDWDQGRSDADMSRMGLEARGMRVNRYMKCITGKMNNPAREASLSQGLMCHPGGWCTGITQRNGMGREVGGGFRMGNTCTPVVDACWCIAKPIQYCKVKKKKNILK